jgi:hypothetical protein
MIASGLYAPRGQGHVLFGVFLLLVLSAAGCIKGSSLPKTYPVTGSVVYKGGRPVAGGAIQFTPADTSYSVTGDINDDGTFTLHTFKDNEKTSGAPEGEYKVIVQPPIGPDQRGVAAIPLPKPYKVEAKDNRFAIEVDPPRKP